jgi:hypothetical protein
MKKKKEFQLEQPCNYKLCPENGTNNQALTLQKERMKTQALEEQGMTL